MKAKRYLLMVRLMRQRSVFLSLVESDSDCKEAYNNLGVIAFQKDDKVKAINYFTRSLEIDPLYRDAVFKLYKLT